MSARGGIDALITSHRVIMSAFLVCWILFKDGFAVSVSDALLKGPEFVFHVSIRFDVT
jgi:hypothetical protein